MFFVLNGMFFARLATPGVTRMPCQLDFAGDFFSIEMTRRPATRDTFFFRYRSCSRFYRLVPYDLRVALGESINQLCCDQHHPQLPLGGMSSSLVSPVTMV
jgi:hypothetical protein